MNRNSSTTLDSITATILAIAHSDIAQRMIREKKRHDRISIITYSAALLLLLVLFAYLIVNEVSAHHNPAEPSNQLQAYTQLHDELTQYRACQANTALSTANAQRQLDCMRHAYQLNSALLLATTYFTLNKQLDQQIEDLLQRDAIARFEPRVTATLDQTLAAMQQQLPDTGTTDRA